MDDAKTNPNRGATTLGAYEAKTKFSELIARAEKGESFVVTKNGRPVARIVPAANLDREKARRAGERIRALLAMQGPPVSESEARRNWEEHKADMERELDERVDRWLKS
jgi:prevent-host-death family protein